MKELDNIFDFVDNFFPTFISVFGFISKQAYQSSTDILKEIKKRQFLINLIELIFVIFHLLFIFFIQNKRVVESSIYYKFGVVFLNLILLIYNYQNSNDEED